MALDGIVISNIKKELEDRFLGARINKIAQPEADELMLTIKEGRKQTRLLISANASLPLIYVTEESKQSPMTAPNFCMLLRKHISGGRIIAIEQPGFERILFFTIEHLDEMGDICHKKLIVELMGKHSNIIFCDDKDMIIDSIKHISAQISSVREVLPGRQYFIPAQTGKLSPLEASGQDVIQALTGKPVTAAKAIYSSFTGFSPLMATELCFRAGVDADLPCAALTNENREELAAQFMELIHAIRQGSYCPNIISHEEKPIEFASFYLTCYRDYECEEADSIFTILQNYYARRDAYTRIHQKSADMRHIVNTLLERSRKKYALQEKQLKDTEKKDKYRKYGELIHIYGYQLKEKSTGFEAEDYETGKTIRIPLDKDLTAMENAKKYFDRYAKLKRTFEALSVQIQDTYDEMTHLASIAAALDIAETEDDLFQIREELASCGYIKKHVQKQKGRKVVSKPYHYLSSDGYDIFVGKNNYQNDELTFKTARGNDWWFHAKGMPGSHVLVKCPDGQMPDRTFEEAAALAAYYSKGRESEKVEVDYLQKKNVKKPNKAVPGFVVYYTNYSMTISPDIQALERLE